jgi:hypothetical protein
MCCSFRFQRTTGEICQHWYDEIAVLGESKDGSRQNCLTDSKDSGRQNYITGSKDDGEQNYITGRKDGTAAGRTVQQAVRMVTDRIVK